MKKITLNAKKMKTRESAHEYMAKKCGFLDDYGKNLDATYDCLSSMAGTQITIKNSKLLAENLEEYGVTLLSVFSDAAKNNTRLQVMIK